MLRLEEKVSHFDRVPSYADWDRRPFGTKTLLEDNLRSFERSHQEQIDSATTLDTKGRIVATQSLQLSSAWVTHFISFIDETYQSFMKQHTFTEEKAWELTTQLGRRVFLEIASLRNGIITAICIGADAQEQISRLVFWAIFRCHDIMKSFKDANFCDHPAIAGEYMKFLTANSGYEVIGQLVSKIESLTTSLAEAVKAAAAATKQAGIASNAVDEMKKRFTEIERQLTKINTETKNRKWDSVIEARGSRKRMSSPACLGPTPVKKSATFRNECAERVLNQGGKRFEIGFLNARFPLTVYIYFENFPIWLFSLDVAWCKKLVILGHESETALLSLFFSSERALLVTLLAPFSKLDKLLFAVNVTISKASAQLIFLSGSLFPYLLDVIDSFSDHVVLGVCDEHYSGRLRNGRPTASNTIDAQRLTAL